MQALLRQLGELFLQAIPTVVLLLLFYWFMRWAFFKPILQAMNEREKRIQGRRQETEEIRREATQTEQTYQGKLREARSENYTAQEAQRKQLLDERAKQVNSARTAAQQRVRVAKEQIGNELKAAEQQVEGQSDALANEIVEGILRNGNNGSREARESNVRK